jgi:hypothetical protein
MSSQFIIHKHPLIRRYITCAVENASFNKLFEPKREDVTGGWREFHNEKLHSLYSSPFLGGDRIKEDEMSGACSVHRGGEKYVQHFGWKA